MAQYSMNAYDADIYLHRFRGLISNGNDPDGNLEYAVEAENVDTTDGFLQPAADPTVEYIGEDYKKPIDELFTDFENSPYWQNRFYKTVVIEGHDVRQPMTPEEKQELIDKFYLYYTGSTTPVTNASYRTKFRVVAKMVVKVPRRGYSGQNEPEWVYSPILIYIFTSGNGFLYVTQPLEEASGLDDQYQCQPLTVTAQIQYPSGDADTTYYEGYDMDDAPDYFDHTWSTAIYQSHPQDDTVQDPKPNSSGMVIHGGVLGVDYEYADNALYLSNKEKGLYCIQVFSARTVGGGITLPKLKVECYKIGTPVNFDHIEAFGERLWGISSAIENESVFYSTPFNPFDWKQNADIPEMGAGDIMEPNWDGDYFTGLKSFGNALILFKKHRAWRVSGVDITSMYITEQYGFGTEFTDTIVTSGERLYMATRNGLALFDGSTVRPLMQDNLRNLWSRINQNAMDKMRGFLYENRKYCLAVPVESNENNTLIVFDTQDGSVLYYENMNITSFQNPLIAQEPIVLWNDGKRSNLKRIAFNAWEKNLAGSRPTKWVSPWLELGRKDIQKGGFDLYFTPEVRGEPVTFTITFQTDKKTKTKSYTVEATPFNEGKQGKTKKIHFGGSGRRFRFILETDPNTSVKWRLYGGLHIIAEIDKD